MIVINLRGGLGNQLFQYSLGYALSKKYKKDLFINIQSYENDTNGRLLELRNLKLDLKILDPDKSKEIFRYNHPYLNKVYHTAKFNFSYYYERTVKKFNPLIISKKKGYFDGYWQSEKYFKDYRSDLLDLFVPKIVSQDLIHLIKKMESEEYVSMHIRKADYLNPQNEQIYAECSLDYYRRAVSILSQKCSSFKLMVFSDDYKWVKEHLLLNIPYEISNSKNTPVEDLFLMSKCKHNIIANSSFSWWGAWLNNNPVKTIIAPKHYYRIESEFREEIFPSEWIRLEN